MIKLELNEQIVRNQQERKRAKKDACYELPNDPRKAYHAVKYSVYRRVMGGNISILNRRKAGARYELRCERKLDSNFSCKSMLFK